MGLNQELKLVLDAYIVVGFLSQCNEKGAPKRGPIAVRRVRQGAASLSQNGASGRGLTESEGCVRARPHYSEKGASGSSLVAVRRVRQGAASCSEKGASGRGLVAVIRMRQAAASLQ
jgi:hypothetical protein